MAKLEKILQVPEKSLIFDRDDDTFFIVKTLAAFAFVYAFL